MPIAYPHGTLAEHVACRTAGVVFDVSHLGTIRIAGTGAFERLQSILTNDLLRISPGHAQYTHLLSEDGSVDDDIIVWWRDRDLFDVMPNASNTERVLGAVGGADVTGERAVIAVQGPQARAMLRSVMPGAALVRRFEVAEVDWEGTPCVVAGTGYTGEDGVEIAVPVDAAGGLWDGLLDAGLAPAGLGARDTLRLEAGLVLHGHDIGPGITPLQAGLGWVVAWGKPSFRGRSALAREREMGPPRLLRGVVVSGRRPPREESPVFRDGRQVGVMTSGNFSPGLSRGIGLALLEPSIEPGDPVQVRVRGEAIDAEITPTPFVKLPSSSPDDAPGRGNGLRGTAPPASGVAQPAGGRPQ